MREGSGPRVARCRRPSADVGTAACGPGRIPRPPAPAPLTAFGGGRQGTSPCGAASFLCSTAPSPPFGTRRTRGTPSFPAPSLVLRCPCAVRAAAARSTRPPPFVTVWPPVPRPAGGWKAAARNGVIGGVLLAFIEGLGVAINHWMAEAARKAQFEAGQGVHGTPLHPSRPAPARLDAPPAASLPRPGAAVSAFPASEHCTAAGRADRTLLLRR